MRKFLFSALSFLALPAFAADPAYKVEELSLKPQPVVSEVREGNPAEAGKEIGAALAHIRNLMLEHKLEPAGRPFVRSLEGGNGKWKFEAGYPIAKKPKLPKGAKLKVTELPGGKALRTVHVGKPEGYKSASAALNEYAEKNKLTKNGTQWFVQKNDLSMVKSPDEFETDFYLPLKK